ncbi:MAG TPA: rhomboid family intramembrane serine protease [Micropepsaceae bacterium]|nr:rhomboid family intramembrane serine protease [Micropepsaceae bacterium]
MIPISDENPARLKPIVTWAVIIACIGVFFWQLSFSESGEEALVAALAFVPKNLFDHAVTAQVYGIPLPWLTLITSMFLHGGFMHLGGNMLYLWIFGNNVEDAMGHGRFLGFYFACGIVAALSEGLINPHSDLPMLGASGAISGVLAAYVLIYPRTRVTVIIPLGILLYPTKISAFYVVGFWFLLQLLNLLGATPGGPGTAWWAHVGGFLAGIVLTPLLSNFPLFGRYRRGPWN